MTSEFKTICLQDCRVQSQSQAISLIINSASKPAKLQTATKLSIHFVTLRDKSEQMHKYICIAGETFPGEWENGISCVAGEKRGKDDLGMNVAERRTG